MDHSFCFTLLWGFFVVVIVIYIRSYTNFVLSNFKNIMLKMTNRKTGKLKTKYERNIEVKITKHV